MNGLALSGPQRPDGTPAAMWRMADPRLLAPPRTPWVTRPAVFIAGLLATGVAAGAAWRYDPPDTIVTTRIVAEGEDDAAARAALDVAAQPWLLAPGNPAQLENAGRTLVLTAREPDFAAAARRIQSVADAVMNHPAAPPAPPATPSTDLRGQLLADRARLQAAMDAAQAQMVATSTALTEVVRDLAGGRAEAARMTNRDALDKGASMLADLQLERLDMLGKYRADFPGIAELDDRIQSLKAFLADEQRRVDAAVAHPATHVDPALSAEQDRLHGEQGELVDRESLLSVQLSHVERGLAAILPLAATQAAVAAPAPVLVQGATTSALAENARFAIVSGIAGLGLALAALAALLVPKRRKAPELPPYSILLQPTQAALQHWAATAPPVFQLPLPTGEGRGGAGQGSAGFSSLRNASAGEGRAARGRRVKP